jgi:hypothetical protein
MSDENNIKGAGKLFEIFSDTIRIHINVPLSGLAKAVGGMLANTIRLYIFNGS